MSQNYHGSDVPAPGPTAGSVKRARERAQAGLPRESLPLRQMPMGPPRPRGYSASPARPPPAAPGPPRAYTPRAQPPGDGRSARPIPRPIHTPQWPLTGPLEPPTVNPRDSEPAAAPSSRAPQRPPRPTNDPLILDQSRLREPNPLYAARPLVLEGPPAITADDDDEPSPAAVSSRHTSSVGSIPDFPVPVAANTPNVPRRSAILGPPPSARRGASSFYSNSSFVSPIPEESPRSRSHGSYASSAAMPENWGAVSPMGSPAYGDSFYDDDATDKEEAAEDFGDESKLVRSASLGKKGKPSLVVTKSAGPNPTERPAPSPVQPHDGGTVYMDISSSSSNTLPTLRPLADTTAAMTTQAQAVLDPGAVPVAAGALGLAGPDGPGAAAAVPSRPPNRLSNMRRPPRLDMDAVRAAESRGSLTSLPDLIRRATRLASMIDKGKRPGSRMDELNFFGEKWPPRDGDGSLSGTLLTACRLPLGRACNLLTRAKADDGQRSGLSGMLAAFPPPVHSPRVNRNSNGSWLRPSSWPAGADQAARRHSRASSIDPNAIARKTNRRCCGLPVWGFVLIAAAALSLIVVAIVVPLEFLVFRSPPAEGLESDIAICQDSLFCANGGTNVVTQNTCSCICTNGFTGPTCAVGGSAGCTTTNLVAMDGSISIQNVTLGRSIPRLVAQSSSNFSVPLSGTIIMAKFNSGGLSCIAQNSLVTFDGLSTRVGEAGDEVQTISNQLKAEAKQEEPWVPSITAITIPPTTTKTVTVTSGTLTLHPVISVFPSTAASSTTRQGGPPFSSLPPPITSIGQTSSPASSSTRRTTTTASAEPTSQTFTPTQQDVDFARVAVLFIAQEDSITAAANAQAELQRLFSRAARGKTLLSFQVTLEEAARVTVGGNNTVNLVNYSVDVGRGPVGRKTS